jgi:putative ABC transport system permease protein
MRAARPPSGRRQQLRDHPQDQLLDTYNKIFGMFFLVMIVLSAIGLLVGGVGAAIMMISVTERTRNRRAQGARRRA